MPRFFTETIDENAGIITGNDAKHIAKVLRMKPGDPITVCDMHGLDYHCVLETADEKQIGLKVLEHHPCGTEPTVAVKLYQAMPKSDKMELIIQKAVELGVDEIIPVQTHRCVSRPDEKSMAKKLERYNRISLEAAKQCGRGKIPEVKPLIDFRQAVEQAAQDSLGILFYENASASFQDALSRASGGISFLVGAEGGFEEDEVAFARETGLEILSLGSRILRCETAPIAALAVMMYQTGNL